MIGGVHAAYGPWFEDPCPNPSLMRRKRQEVPSFIDNNDPNSNLSLAHCER